MTLIIRTNNQARPLLDWQDLSPKERLEFDWMDESDQASASFVRYRGWVYALSEFLAFSDKEGPLKGWHGYHSDTAFSSVIIRIPDDNPDNVAVMGMAFS